MGCRGKSIPVEWLHLVVTRWGLKVLLHITEALLPVSPRGPSRTGEGPASEAQLKCSHGTSPQRHTEHGWLDPNLALSATAGSEHRPKCSPYLPQYHTSFLLSVGIRHACICPVTDKNPQQKQRQQPERQGCAISIWYYPVTERVTVLTFKTLCWLLMISGKGNVSKYRHHLSTQQTSLLSQEFSQFKLNCADQQLLEEATFLFKSIWLPLSCQCFCLELPSTQKHHKPNCSRALIGEPHSQ